METCEKINVTRVVQDDDLQEVFKDSLDVYYAATRLPHLQFLVQHTLTIEKLGIETRIRDSYGNHYRTLEWNEVRDLMWKGRPLFTTTHPASTARPGQRAYSGETKVPTFVYPEPTFSEWTTGRQPPAPWSTAPVYDCSARIEPSLGRQGIMRPPGRVLAPHVDIIDPRPARRHEDDHHRRVRPSALQKLVKKYDGSGDPHDHVAAFRQAVHAEQVRDTHTQIEGFGLTLESKAFTWFQTLGPEIKVSLTSLEKDFISAFSKMGIKHNTVAQIYSFKQKDHESVRDCVNRLKQYILRCPDEEKPSQARLISVFLEGLKDKMLHAHLYARKHSMFNECCLDAMDYDDNFEMGNSSSHSENRSPPRSSNSGTSSSRATNPEQLNVDLCQNDQI